MPKMEGILVVRWECPHCNYRIHMSDPDVVYDLIEEGRKFGGKKGDSCPECSDTVAGHAYDFQNSQPKMRRVMDSED